MARTSGVARAFLGTVLVASAATAQGGRTGSAAPAPSRACDTLYAVAKRTPGTSVTRRTGRFIDETIRDSVPGCGIRVAGSFAKARAEGDAALLLRKRLEADGWRELGAYSADGTDGTSFAFTKDGVTCLARGNWNGGADGTPPIPAADWYRVVAFCTVAPIPERRL